MKSTVSEINRFEGESGRRASDLEVRGKFD